MRLCGIFHSTVSAIFYYVAACNLLDKPNASSFRRFYKSTSHKPLDLIPNHNLTPQPNFSTQFIKTNLLTNPYLTMVKLTNIHETLIMPKTPLLFQLITLSPLSLQSI